jgi:hypothetical protein
MFNFQFVLWIYARWQWKFKSGIIFFMKYHMSYHMYSGGQKFLNDHSKWHNFFVSQPIDLKFWLKLHITIVYFLAKNLKVWYLSGRSYDFKSEFVKVKSIQTIRILGFTVGKNMNQPGFLVEFIFT